ncbi:MAG: replicative DNA helicase [Clostridia bacterium]|nr:replicative DNA helicase [Clostridia bacterium]
MDIQNENLIQGVMPHNKEAEQSVLGAMLLNRDCVTTAFEGLSDADFYIEANKKIFTAMASLFNRNVAVDLVTVSDELNAMSALEAVGGIQYLSYLASTLPTTANIEQHIEIIREKSLRRKLADAAQKIKDQSLDAGANALEVADFAGKLIFDTLESKSRDIRHIKDVLIDTHENLTNIYNSKGKLTGVPTGFSSLDGILNGLQKSDLILLAARPSVGKTSFALNIAANAAIKGNVPVAIFSLEMSGTQLVSRIMSSEMLIDSGHLRSGELEDDDWEKIALALNTLGKAPIYISENTSVKVSDIRATCRRLKAEKGLGLIVIDYLQLMQGNRSESRQQEVSDMSRSLKLLAKELNIPILTLSQLSRATEQRKDDNKPKLSDLRESGAIEQDADIVLFLYRDVSTEEETNIVKLNIAKHRSGSLGTIDLVWKGEYTRFFDKDIQH